ncbi:MAG: 50S ribosomal protein L3 [bacterium]|nr:50S ribosomal protein L3 [bacterium]
MKKLIAKKVEMTQIFDEGGEVFPVTVLVADDLSRPSPSPDSAKASTGEQGEGGGEVLKEGDIVTVTGTSKGKGFQGVVKRHGFEGGRRSHGQKHSEREAGSIGGGGRAGGRVVKGMRMAGRMGNEKVTVKNLKIIKMVPETGELYIRGAIPGRRGTKIIISGK